MAQTLCETWAALAERPADKTAAADARARVLELLEHVDDCPACRAVSEQVTSPELVFGALSGDDAPLTAEEQELRGRLAQVLADEASDIDSAVDALLADMPEGQNTLEQIAPSLTSAQLVSAVNAVNMLVRSFAARDRGQTIELTDVGLRLGDTIVADRAAIVREIAKLAGVSVDAGKGILDWQLVAGESVERLYRGLLVESSAPGALRLAIDHDHAEEPLAARWRQSEPEFEFDTDLDLDVLPAQIRECVEEIVVLDQGMAPALERAAANFRTAGDTDFSTLLSDRSREAKVERQKLVDIIAELSKHRPAQQAAARGRGFYKKPKYDFIVMGKDRVEIVDYVKGFEKKKKVYFGKIAATRYTGKIDIKPLKEHATHCMMLSAQRIKRFDGI